MKAIACRSVLALACFLLFSCEDTSVGSAGALEVVPVEVVFPAPLPDEPEQTIDIELRNVGGGPLKVASIVLEEDDPLSELSIVDADAWSRIRDIPPGTRATVTVAWRPQDARAETGRLIISHNAGAATVVPIRTTRVDPVIQVSTTPNGTAENKEITQVLSDALPGRSSGLRSSCKAVAWRH